VPDAECVPGAEPVTVGLPVVYADDRTADHNATDQRAADHNATDDNATDHRATDDNATDHNATDHNATDQRATDDNATDRLGFERWQHEPDRPADNRGFHGLAAGGPGP
jgi:hypothetical protein